MAKKLLHVVGARPNFMKAAPVLEACGARGFEQVLVHTGQHYDAKMSDIFFTQLGIPEPDFNLDVGKGSHAQQTAEVMLRFEKVVLEVKPDMVLVYGDVNSTLAAALVCAKLLIPVAHVEAGLRSFDNTMPEEVNRRVVDHICDFLFTTCTDADENLSKEGIAASKVFFVGNVMIDTLMKLKSTAEKSQIREQLSLKAKGYILATLHRPSNVDDLKKLKKLLVSLDRIGQQHPVVFPLHPRTKAKIAASGQVYNDTTLRFIDPLGYIDFIKLQMDAALVITDSGGVQEETTALGVTCLTLRLNTERPVTITEGTNVLVGEDPMELERIVQLKLSQPNAQRRVPQLWDGRAAHRIAAILEEL